MKNNRIFFWVIVSAVLIKLVLFSVMAIGAPEYKFGNDSFGYMASAAMLYERGAFAQLDEAGIPRPEVQRTPGYPFFLAVFHHLLRIPYDGILLLQIFLGILAAFIVSKTAELIDVRLCCLSAAIVLLDFPIHRYSLMLLTEILFLVMISLFLFGFVKYLKRGESKWLLFSALMVVLSVYVRPVSYYLGVPVAFFVVYANRLKNYKRSFFQAVIFLIVIYALLGCWQLRNYKCRGSSAFSSIANFNLNTFGLIKGCVLRKEMETRGLDFSIASHAYIVLRSFNNFMMMPGSLKYLSHENLKDIIFLRFLRNFLQGLSYCVLIFWFLGFIVGVARIGKNIYYQFMLLVILYFLSVSIISTTLWVAPRLRIPAIPFIAIISAYGWLVLRAKWPGIHFRNSLKA